jgi:23S rRNA (adenine2030-N6)-methyltransferase
MAAAQVLLWYPVVQRDNVNAMLRALVQSSLRDLWQVELGIEPDSTEHGMTASGLVLLNPPWTLAAQLREALPRLQEQLAPASGHWVVKNLVGE